MTQRDDERERGGVATPEPPMPAYDEGRTDSVHEGVGQGVDEDPRTGEGVPAETDDRAPKLSDRIDQFVSSEVAERIPPYSKTTS